MRENFIYEIKQAKRDRRFYRCFYSFHISLLSEIQQLFKITGSRKFDLIQDEKDNYDMIPLEIDNVLFITQDILRKKFPQYFLEIYQLLNKLDRIRFYDEDSLLLEEKYDKGAGPCCIVNKYINNIYLYLPLSGEIYDVFSFVHELSHFMIGGFDEKIASHYLSECIPIFSEFITLDYCLEHFKGHPCIFEFLHGRYSELIGTKQFLEKKKDYKLTFAFFERSVYAINLLLSSKLYSEYLKDKVSAMKKIEKFIDGIGILHFNRLMEILDVKIKYYNGQLRYETGELEKLYQTFDEVCKIMDEKYKETLTIYEEQKKLKKVL